MSKTKYAILAIALVVLFVGATAAYGSLSKNYIPSDEVPSVPPAASTRADNSPDGHQGTDADMTMTEPDMQTSEMTESSRSDATEKPTDTTEKSMTEAPNTPTRKAAEKTTRKTTEKATEKATEKTKTVTPGRTAPEKPKKTEEPKTNPAPKKNETQPSGEGVTQTPSKPVTPETKKTVEPSTEPEKTTVPKVTPRPVEETTKEPETTKPKPKTNTAPDFTVLDKNGNRVHLSDFFGKPVVINFWATWCPPCRQELPDFDKLSGEYGDRVVFMMVNLTDGYRDTVSGTKRFVANNGYSFPLYFDTEYNAAAAYNVSSIPQTTFIDANGNVYTSRIGAMNEATLRHYLNKLLEG